MPILILNGTSRLNQRQYWRRLGALFITLLILGGIIVFLLEPLLKNAMSAETLHILTQALIFVDAVVSGIFLLRWVTYRARDVAGPTEAWVLFAIIVPVGIFILGLLPSNNQHK